MSAATHNITVEQGASFYRAITIKDGDGVAIDISGWTIRGQIRASQSANKVLANFDCTILNQISDPGGATIELDADDTAAVAARSASGPELINSTFLYDIEAVRPDNSVLRLLQGTVTFIPEITK